MAIRVRTFGMSVDSIVTTKCNVDQTTLVGIHGRKRNTLVSANCSLGS